MSSETDPLEIAPIKLKYSKYYRKFDKLLKGKTWEDYWEKQTQKREYFQQLKSKDKLQEIESEHFKVLNKISIIDTHSSKIIMNLPKLENPNLTTEPNNRHKRMKTEVSAKDYLHTDKSENLGTNPNIDTVPDAQPLKTSPNKKFKVSKNVSPDPARYNPNYESINKKIPFVVIKKQSEAKFALGSVGSSHLFTQTLTQNSLSVLPTGSGANLNTTKSQAEMPLTSEFNTIKDGFVDQINLKKCRDLKFENYLKRKDMMLVQSKVVSYIEPDRVEERLANKGKNLEFEKMSSRKQNLFRMNENPSPLAYNPSIKSVISNVQNVKIGKTRLDFHKRHKSQAEKKFFINKIWKNYDVNSDYKLVNLEPFNAKLLEIERHKSKEKLSSQFKQN